MNLPLPDTTTIIPPSRPVTLTQTSPPVGAFLPLQAPRHRQTAGAWITLLKHFTLFKDPHTHRDCVCVGVCVCVCVCVLIHWIWFLEGRLPGSLSAPHKPPHNQEILQGDRGGGGGRRTTRDSATALGLDKGVCRVKTAGGRKERRGSGCLAQRQSRTPELQTRPNGPPPGSGVARLD